MNSSNLPSRRLSPRLLPPPARSQPVAHLVCVAAIALGACAPSTDAPHLESIPDQVAQVGEQLIIVVAATDGDGSALNYSFDAELQNILDHGEMTVRPDGAGVFRWRPLGQDVGTWRIEFTAENGSASDTIPVKIEVKSAVGTAGTPIFREPLGSGTSLRVDEHECIDVHVLVDDQDSATVTISQQEPTIAGATLTSTGARAATWHWCPSASQISAGGRYQLLLAADDTVNQPTLFPFQIVLRSAAKPDCPGAAPTITHSPTDSSSLSSVVISATLSDDRGLKGEPLLYYSTTQPASPPDLAAMTQVTMALQSGTAQSGTWNATLPNPVASAAAGTSATLHYVIVADDNDDAAGSCDHLTQAPTTGAYRMTVTNPGGSGGTALCAACTTNLQCGAAQDLCVRVGSTASPSCLQSCGSDLECPENYRCSPSPLTSIDGATGRQCVPQSENCADPAGTTCTDDHYENNDNATQALSNPVLWPGTYSDMTSCPDTVSGDDEDWYPIFLLDDARVDLELAGTNASDLDLALYDETGSYIAGSVSTTSVEEISECIPAGVYYIRVYAFSPQPNNYQLNYAETVQACGAPPPSCTPDAAEDDDSSWQATPAYVYPNDYTAVGRTICANDDDWYSLELFYGDVISVDLAFTHAAGDLDLKFLDTAGVDYCTAESCRSSTDNEQFQAQVTDSSCTPCIFNVVVQGYSGAENSYELRMGL